MPIKLPKSFVRRKSSGNALEEVQNAPAPSFKVFERSPAGNRSWDGTNGLKQPSQVRTYQATENNFDEELYPVNKDDSRNRGSGGTNNSASTAPYGSAASSARLSSSSTIPSSTDISNDSHTNSMVSGQRPFQDVPVPPTPRSRGWSIRNAGRTFSFASKQKNEAAPEPVPFLPQPRSSPITTQSTTFTPGRRERAMTASSASTATPPKLLEGELSFGDSDLDGFGNMFDSFANRSNRDSASPYNSRKTDLPPLPYGSVDLPASQQPSPLPPSLDIDRARAAASSPYSQASHDSRDGLMDSPSPTQSQSRTIPSSPVRRKALPSFHSMPDTQAPSNPLRGATSDLRGQVISPYTKSPSPIEDEDAKLLARPTNHRQSLHQPNTNIGATRRFEPKTNGAKDDNSDNEELLFSTPSPNHPTISRTAPKRAVPPSSFRQIDNGAVDPSLADSFRAAAHFEANAPGQEKPAKKVMTPAQFERYRQQQELSRKRSDVSQKDNSDGENDNYEDDDEVERDREAAKQRRKQEAHLAVYRQTMMKVTGESSGGPSSNVGQSGRLTSMSTPELSRMSHLTVGTGISSHSGKSSGTDEEDEDVPLGILAAHGFPNKNKPPSRLQTSLSNSNLRGSVPVSAPPASVSGESRAGFRGNLPVFARNLPQDPYYGAGLVNPPNREQFSMGGGQSSFGGVAQGQVHPSGLVGVIAGEERARAMRRGSPNQQANHDQLIPAQHPGMMGRSQTMGPGSTMNGYAGSGMPGMMPQALTPGDQAQIQMAQQMNQMMQMQMQWMQQMTQMQQNGQMGQTAQSPQPGMMPMPNMMGMPAEMGNPNQRPFSMPLPDSPRQNGRAMSLTPGMTGQWNRNSSYSPSMAGGQGGYAPSIAPSERNTVGMASRYRPVSIVAESIKAPDNRASTFTSSSYQPWAQDSEQGRLSPSNTNTTIRPTSNSGLGRKVQTADDDDDDQGWADMKKKRDKKKGMWKMKKSEKSEG